MSGRAEPEFVGVRISQGLMERMDDAMRESGFRFRNRSHLITVALDSFLSDLEEELSKSETDSEDDDLADEEQTGDGEEEDEEG